jgi:hypothetical protein
MPDETQDPSAARGRAKKPAREPEPQPEPEQAPAASPAQDQALDLVELEALRSRLIAKFHGRR